MGGGMTYFVAYLLQSAAPNQKEAGEKFIIGKYSNIFLACYCVSDKNTEFFKNAL